MFVLVSEPEFKLVREQFCEIGIDDALIKRDFIFDLLIINMELYHTVQGYSVWYMWYKAICL